MSIVPFASLCSGQEGNGILVLFVYELLTCWLSNHLVYLLGKKTSSGYRKEDFNPGKDIEWSKYDISSKT